MLFAAILGGLAGAILVVTIPRVFGAARQRAPRWFGFLRISYVRTMAGAICGITLAAGISLCISDHSHKTASYIAWFGLAAISFAVVLATTIVIERRLAHEGHATEERATPTDSSNHKMNRLLREQWQALKANRAVSATPLSDADHKRIARETEGRLVREATDDMMRSLDAQNTAAIQRDTDSHIKVGEKLLQEITSAQSQYQWQPQFTAPQTVADLTAYVESWASEVGGYVVPEPAKDWRLTLSRLKIYVEKQNSALRARRSK